MCVGYDLEVKMSKCVKCVYVCPDDMNKSIVKESIMSKSLHEV